MKGVGSGDQAVINGHRKANDFTATMMQVIDDDTDAMLLQISVRNELQTTYRAMVHDTTGFARVSHQDQGGAIANLKTWKIA